MRTRLEKARLSRATSRPRTAPIVFGDHIAAILLHEAMERWAVLGHAFDQDARAAGEDIRREGDPVVAIFEKYFYDAVSPRIHPSEEADAWFRSQVTRSRIEGVLFYVPQEDDVVGWDYPRHLAWLQSRGVPSLLIRNNAAPEVAGFVERLRRG